LLRKDVYYLEEEKLYIPLWHEEIVFHGKIKAIIHPVLPKGVELDEENNIWVSYSKELPDRVFQWISILMEEMPERKEHVLRFKKKGIPKIQTFIYDAQELSDVIVLLSL
jgi:hypothetical protein